MKKEKKALIVEGGGNRGVFSLGITDSFIKENFDPFDIHIGVSNGAAVLFWYLMRETDNNLEKILFGATAKYINYKNIFIVNPPEINCTVRIAFFGLVILFVECSGRIEVAEESFDAEALKTAVVFVAQEEGSAPASVGSGDYPGPRIVCRPRAPYN